MMNLSLDIFAAAQTGATPTPVGTATGGPSAGDGLFAQLLAGAAAGAPQPSALPIAAFPVIGLSSTEMSISLENLAEPTVAPIDNRVVGETLNHELIKNEMGKPIGGTASVIPQPQVGPDIFGGAATSAATGTIMHRVPSMESLSQLVASGIPQVQESRLKNLIEAGLASLSGARVNDAEIKATVVVVENAEEAFTSAPAKNESAGSFVPNDEEPLLEQRSMSRATDRVSSSLKGNLRRAFPSLNIESASGKADVQLKLTEPNAQARVKAEIPTPNQTPLSTNGLPIAVAPQIAAVVPAARHATAPIRPARQVRIAGEASKPATVKLPVEGEVPVRLENRVAIRKPVQVVPKSQGFDIEKLMSSNGSTKEPLVERIAIDRTDFKVTVDKPVQQATDRSFELNGTERFKLDIKRGHIEALLKRGEIKLQLQPEHLGHLKIRLMTTPTEVNARLETSSEDAKHAVELSLPQLRESFERAGLKLNSIEVSVNDDSDFRRQHAFQQGWRGREGGVRTLSDPSVVDVPATAEISQNLHTTYGGALNLVA